MTISDFEKLCGWVDNPKQVAAIMEEQAYPLFGPACAATGAPGAIADAVERLLPLRREDAPADVLEVRRQDARLSAAGAGSAVDILKAEAVAAGSITWNGETSTEAIHGLARIEISKGMFGRSPGGTSGASAGQACKKYGTLVRKKYGQYDLTAYNPKLTDLWGDVGRGLPDELEPFAKENIVQGISLVTTWSELCDAIWAGYPVTIASQCGFVVRGRSVRDAQGFLQRGGSWNHQMCIVGYSDEGPRPWALILNSWGPHWVTGPLLLDEGMVPGSFKADAEIVEKYILRAQDSFVYSDFKGGGFPVRYKTTADLFRPRPDKTLAS